MRYTVEGLVVAQDIRRTLTRLLVVCCLELNIEFINAMLDSRCCLLSIINSAAMAAFCILEPGVICMPESATRFFT